MSKSKSSTPPTVPSPSEAEPVSEPLFTDERVAEAGKAVEASVAKYAAKHPDEPSATPAKKAVPAPAAPLTAAELVEIGLAASNDGVRDSAAATAARRSVLESVAAMMLAAR